MPADSLRQGVCTPGVTTQGLRDDNYCDALDVLPRKYNSRKEGLRKRSRKLERRPSTKGIYADDKSLSGVQIGGGQIFYDGTEGLAKRKATRSLRTLLDASETGENLVMAVEGPIGTEDVRQGIPVVEEDQFSEAPDTKTRVSTAVPAKQSLKPDFSDMRRDLNENTDGSSTAETEVRSFEPDNEKALPSPSYGVQVRNRWFRAKAKLAVVHHISDGHRRTVSGDLLGNGGEEQTVQHVKSMAASKADAPAVDDARLKKEAQGSSRQVRAKGRKGMEGMIVRQDKGMIAFIQDFYVACLKLPIDRFLIGVFLAPIALGLFFTPMYLFDKGGLSINDGHFFNASASADESVMVGRAANAKHNFSHLIDVFLYALSLSTTFGGSPVAALSTYCLCVANVNSLMGQFLFVFLSGAVFARMSQPSQPIRCAKKAVIRADDFISSPSEERKDKPKVFAVRLVLTGPPPCELVDAKIRLTFKIMVTLPTGSVFCSTQDLTLVRPEISYLRYGLLVRHVIDSRSPIHGFTMEALMDGDASFSLTIMGTERASMQPIFHLEDYFVCDGDVAWDADYIDFIHVNKAGNRVLDHSKLDLIRVTEDTKMAGNWKEKRQPPLGKTLPKYDQAGVRGATASQFAKSISTVWRSKSNSFTRFNQST